MFLLLSLFSAELMDSNSQSQNPLNTHLSFNLLLTKICFKYKKGDDCISIVSNSSRIRIKNIFCSPGHGIR